LLEKKTESEIGKSGNRFPKDLASSSSSDHDPNRIMIERSGQAGGGVSVNQAAT